MKTALVTGHRGFIGRHLHARLLADGWDVTGVDIKEGLDCRDLFRESGARYDAVFHCAAIVGGRAKIDGAPLEVATDLAIDSDYFQFVARTRPRRAVYFSSSAAYPVSLQSGALATRLRESHISDRLLGNPDAVYGWVKLTGERVAELVGGMTVFRPFSGYGYDQDSDYPFPSFIRRAIELEDPFTVWGSGTQVRDWIHVDDIVDKVIASLDIDPVTVNLCTGRGASMLDLIRIACSQAGYNPDIEPNLGAPVGVHYRVGNPRLMNDLLGPASVLLEEGVARALAATPRWPR